MSATAINCPEPTLQPRSPSPQLPSRKPRVRRDRRACTMDDEGLNLAKIIAWSHLSAQAIQLGLVDSSQINSCDQMMRQGLYRTLWEEL
ncbi:hypothetical protein LTS18_010601, partial [Coniosporium uncinatum]